jgi:hypothetical protein
MTYMRGSAHKFASVAERPQQRGSRLPGGLQNLGTGRQDKTGTRRVVAVPDAGDAVVLMPPIVARQVTYPVVFSQLGNFSNLRLVERKMLFYRGAAGHGV